MKGRIGPSRFISIRVSVEEHAVIARLAELEDKTLSDLGRTIILRECENRGLFENTTPADPDSRRLEERITPIVLKILKKHLDETNHR